MNSSLTKVLHSALGLFSMLLIAGCTGSDIASHIDRATSMVSSYDLPSAVIELKNALQSNPNSLPARRLLGEVYLKLGNGAAAQKELNKALELGDVSPDLHLLRAKALFQQDKSVEAFLMLEEHAPEQPFADFLVLHGDLKGADGNWDSAAADYEAALSLTVDYVPALLGLSRVALFGRDFDAADDYLTRAERQSWRGPEVALARGDLEQIRGNSDAAVAAYEAARLAAPFDLRSTLSLVRVHLGQRDTQEAKPLMDKLSGMMGRSPELLYLRGYSAVIDKDYAAATDFLREAHGINPGDGRIQLLLGLVLFAQGEQEQAESFATAFNLKYPQHLEGKKLLAAIQLRRGQSKAAARTIDAGSSKQELDSEAKDLLAAALASSGDMVHAEQYLAKYSEPSSATAGLQAHVALGDLKSGKLDDAAERLRSAISMDSSLTNADTLLIYTLVRKEDFEGALRVAEAYVAKAGTQAASHNAVGYVRWAMKDADGAKKAFHAALDREPSNKAALINLVAILSEEGDLAGGMALLDRALAEIPDDPDFLLAKANLAQRQGDVHSAVASLERARAADSQALAPRVLLARLYTRFGAYDQALAVAAEADRLSPLSPAVLAVLAEAQSRGGSPAQALETANRLEQMAPESFEASYQKGLALLANGDLDAARPALDRALTFSPNNLLVYDALARLALRAGNLVEAERLLNILMREAPQDPMVLQLKGDADLAAGDDENALVQFKKAYASLATSTTAVRVARALAALGRLPQAAEFLEEHAKRQPDDLRSMAYLAGLYQAMGDGKSEAAVYRQMLERDPGNPFAANNLAWVLFNQGAPEAQEYARLAYERAPGSHVIQGTYGWILVNTGKLDSGVALLQKSLQLNPNPTTQIRLADAVARQGHVAEALAMLNDLLKGAEPFEQASEAEALRHRLEAMR